VCVEGWIGRLNSRETLLLSQPCSVYGPGGRTRVVDVFVVLRMVVCIPSRAHFLQLEQRGWGRAYIAVHSTLAHGGEGPLCSDCCRRHGVTTERFPRSLANLAVS
jgi:hypothetical protein